jgi:hypothetical protein
VLREGHQPLGRVRAGHLPGAAVRGGARERRLRSGHPHGRLREHEHHGEYARLLSDRAHPEREDPVHGRAPNRRDLPDVRCLPTASCRRWLG